MTLRLDEETIERLRILGPEKAVVTARDAVFATEEAGSEDFLDLYDRDFDRIEGLTRIEPPGVESPAPGP